MPDLVLGYITAPDQAVAEQISNQLIQQKLVACANILGSCKSAFFWEDQVKQETEVTILIKTIASNMDNVVMTVKRLHPYQCPCIIFLPIIGGNPDFLSCVRQAGS